MATAPPAKPATQPAPAKPATPLAPAKPATPLAPVKPATPLAPVKPATGREKTGRPHAHFAEPIDVVDDQALSHAQKSAALESLEQDARQMAAASSEGMGGGEPTTLRAVLTAQASLALPPVAAAYDVVARDLQRRQAAEPAGDLQNAIGQALAALAALPAPTD